MGSLRLVARWQGVTYSFDWTVDPTSPDEIDAHAALVDLLASARLGGSE